MIIELVPSIGKAYKSLKQAQIDWDNNQPFLTSSGEAIRKSDTIAGDQLIVRFGKGSKLGRLERR